MSHSGLKYNLCHWLVYSPRTTDANSFDSVNKKNIENVLDTT